MGQQQLLLVILVTIIVGIATVVAINVFGTSAESANRDAVRQDVLTIAASAQGWYIKPTMMDGGGNTFTDMTFNDISFPADKIESSSGLIAENMNGTYTLSGGAVGEITITADPSSCEGYSSTLASPTTAPTSTQCTNPEEEMVAKILPSDLDWQS